MKRIIRFICIVALVIGLLPLGASIKTYAASSPVVYNKTSDGTQIELGTNYALEFGVMRAFQNENLNVDIYYGQATSDNSKVASSTTTYKNSGEQIFTQTINWDTSNCAPGIYTVVYYMDYYTMGNWNTTTAYKFTVKVYSDQYGSFDDSETGYTMAEAYSAELDTQYMKAWTSANDNASNLHKITLPDQGKLTLTMTKPRTSTGTNSRVNVSVYSDKGTIASAVSLGKVSDLLDSYEYSVYLNKGTYYVDILLGSSVYSGSINSVYSFSFESNSTSEIEPNNTPADANILVNGTMLDAFFDDGYTGSGIDEDDYYKFDVTAGDTVTVKLGNYAALDATSAIMELQPPTGSSVSFFHRATADANDVGQYSFVAESSGTCSIRIYNYSKESIPYQIGYVAEGSGSSEEENAAEEEKQTQNNEEEKAAEEENQTQNNNVAAGDAVTVGGNGFTVTSVKGKTVGFTKAKNKNSVTVPATVTISGTKYKVTQVNANAFKGKKIKTITIGKNVKVIKKNAFKGSSATKLILKTKLLKKAKVKGCLKSSKIKTIQVKIGSKTVNKKFVKSYKKIFTKANAGKKVSVK